MSNSKKEPQCPPGYYLVFEGSVRYGDLIPDGNGRVDPFAKGVLERAAANAGAPIGTGESVQFVARRFRLGDFGCAVRQSFYYTGLSGGSLEWEQ